MQAQWFNRGKRLALQWAFRKESIPTQLFIALVTDGIAPVLAMKTLSQLEEVAAGNGYTSGGIAVPMDVIGFDTIEENDSTNIGLVRIRDIQWDASGGQIPATGNAPRYAVLTTDDVAVGSRQLIAWWDLGPGLTSYSGQSLVLADMELRLQEA